VPERTCHDELMQVRVPREPRVSTHEYRGSSHEPRMSTLEYRVSNLEYRVSTRGVRLGVPLFAVSHRLVPQCCARAPSTHANTHSHKRKPTREYSRVPLERCCGVRLLLCLLPSALITARCCRTAPYS
jgi:hypothetical protein